MKNDPLLSETMKQGRFQVTEILRRGPYRSLCLAEDQQNREARYLASIISVARHPPVADLWQTLGYRVPGIMELAFLGHFDIQGEDPIRQSEQEHHWAMLERVPPGAWLPSLTRQPLGGPAAIQLGLSAGEILLRAAAHGVLLTDIRPDFIWAEQRGDMLDVTGLTARSLRFFEYQARGGTTLLFERRYESPDFKTKSSASLTFTLATMMAEWATGEFPFPGEAGGNRLPTSQSRGEPSPLDLPQPFAQVLQRAFTADPARRPALAQFLDELRALRAVDLAT